MQKNHTNTGPKNMKELVDLLVSQKVIVSEKVYKTMISIDRKDFAPTNPYENM